MEHFNISATGQIQRVFSNKGIWTRPHNLECTNLARVSIHLLKDKTRYLRHIVASVLHQMLSNISEDMFMASAVDGMKNQDVGAI